ncbi:MAG: nitroreductase [Candidatus Omnitrophota bacterium]|nr:MAG: nitroreductase [Candidatus Omnitrophota bacterium]
MDALRLIRTRRSVRRFKKARIPDAAIEKILEAARWAPSGLNNQPWRFMVLEKDQKDVLADFTHYSYIVRGADKVILVFLDRNESYNYAKDIMAIGACIQNMLLYIHASGLGACWLGEILNKRKEIARILTISSNLELEAVIALGKPGPRPKRGSRKKLNRLVIPL